MKCENKFVGFMGAIKWWHLKEICVIIMLMDCCKAMGFDNLITNKENVVGFLKNGKKNGKTWKWNLVFVYLLLSFS